MRLGFSDLRQYSFPTYLKIEAVLLQLGARPSIQEVELIYSCYVDLTDLEDVSFQVEIGEMDTSISTSSLFQTSAQEARTLELPKASNTSSTAPLPSPPA
jgi:hypothetical protein